MSSLSSSPAVRRKPGGQAPELSHNYSILAGYEGENAPSREAVIDEFGQMTGAEELGYVPVDWREAAFARTLEQSG